jgi:predicted RNA-binding protein with PUA-like domain
MAFWLVKTEPFKYSWQQLVADGQTCWDGVRNYAARNNLRAMAKGDQVLVYHSNEGLEVVGIAKVVKTAYQDPTTEEAAWLSVDLKPHKALKTSVGLSQIKADPLLSGMEMIRLNRLSVTSVKPEEFDRILLLGNTKP